LLQPLQLKLAGQAPTRNLPVSCSTLLSSSVADFRVRPKIREDVSDLEGEGPAEMEVARPPRARESGAAMPELPDVEMTRRDLKRWLVGATVTAAATEDARLSRPASPPGFARALVGRTFERVERRGKWLRLDLDDGGKVFSHLGMTGGWVRADIGAPAVRFERARIDGVLRGRAFSVR
jgi:Formamidopyrimidine-DNA glycosylase N-terminal domain